GADLSGADLGDVPVVEEIDVKICEEVCGMPDKLEMNVYHTCETTHSRAGWHVHLAGKKGYDLEERVGPSAAGALIYAASSLFRVPDFFATNEDALADIKERADKARMTGEVKG
ncbi:MAG TPA: hypothetical protein VKA94_11005, partial [Hyphomicrobiales bacterium]|nr:hypothetical protein [Hyphomicrobiales bacterium]